MFRVPDFHIDFHNAIHKLGGNTIHFRTRVKVNNA